MYADNFNHHFNYSAKRTLCERLIMKTLIAATDFSNTSLNAVNYAADMAAAINARLEVLHVMQVPVITDIPDYVPELEDEMYEQRNHKLQLLKQKLEKRTAHRITVICNIMEGGTNSTIKDVAETKKPLAIILGSKGVSNLETIAFGSVALHTAKHAGFPVLLIPEKAKFKSVSAIAFATDLVLENSTQLIKDLRKWLGIFDARLDVVNVNDTASFKNEKENQFASFKKRFSQYNVYFNYVVNDSVPDGISSYIKAKKPDILVLMYHKESFLHKLVFRSEFANIFRSTGVPLLVISD
jgi:nucleotide-binding universal stress UspA family protein